MYGTLMAWINSRFLDLLYMAAWMGMQLLLLRNIARCFSYSRRLLWLTVGTSNNNPRVVAYHYLECVKRLGGLYSNCIAVK